MPVSPALSGRPSCPLPRVNGLRESQITVTVKRARKSVIIAERKLEKGANQELGRQWLSQI
jgi:hypothetical protein